MKRKKTFIIGLTVAIIALCAGLGGTALADDNDEESRSDSVLGRVADILGIDQELVEDAFAQAQSELREEKTDSFLQRLIDDGVITEDQAAEYREWMESRPDPAEFRDRMKEWMEAMPDMPDGTVFKHFRTLPHMGGMHENDGLCSPVR